MGISNGGARLNVKPGLNSFLSVKIQVNYLDQISNSYLSGLIFFLLIILKKAKI